MGRFRGQSVNQRICQLCKNEVETEIHFLFEFPAYDRDDFLRLTTLNQVPDNVERVKLCMSNYQKLNVKFAVKLWNKRQNLITIWGETQVCYIFMCAVHLSDTSINNLSAPFKVTDKVLVGPGIYTFIFCKCNIHVTIIKQYNVNGAYD